MGPTRIMRTGAQKEGQISGQQCTWLNTITAVQTEPFAPSSWWPSTEDGRASRKGPTIRNGAINVPLEYVVLSSETGSRQPALVYIVPAAQPCRDPTMASRFKGIMQKWQDLSRVLRKRDSVPKVLHRPSSTQVDVDKPRQQSPRPRMEYLGSTLACFVDAKP